MSPKSSKTASSHGGRRSRRPAVRHWSRQEHIAFRLLYEACERYVRDLSLWIPELVEEVLKTPESLTELEYLLRLATEGFLREAKWPLDLFGRTSVRGTDLTSGELWTRQVYTAISGLWRRTLQKFRRAIKPPDSPTPGIERFRSLLRCNQPSDSGQLHDAIFTTLLKAAEDAQRVERRLRARLVQAPDQWQDGQSAASRNSHSSRKG